MAVHALYLHVPFCAQKCAYCDFASWPTCRADPLMERYVETLVAQLREARSLGLLEGCRTAYVGGGTPTLLGAGLLARLVQAVREVAPGLTELSCEANPDSLDAQVLAALVDAGATRVSLGVQSLDDRELVALGRIHTADAARLAVQAAVRSALDVSIDLMCATPCQDDRSWARTLDEAVSLGVGHVSVYPLQIEEATPLGRELGNDDPAWNDPEVQARRMVAARDVLEAAGLMRYEVASYARAGRSCLHNEAYWTGQPYLGLGCGAASMLGREEYELLRAAAPGLPQARVGEVRVRLSVAGGLRDVLASPSLAAVPLDLEFLTDVQAVAEDLMLGMRMTRGIGPQLLGRARKALDAGALSLAVESCVSRGLARWDGERLVPTEDGWLLGNELYGTLWALAPGDVRTART